MIDPPPQPPSVPLTRVVSFRPRRHALTTSQQRAWDTHWPGWGEQVPHVDHGPAAIGVDATPPGQDLPGRLDTAAWFGRDAPLVLEIGSGTGTSTAAMAAAEPDVDVLAVEVYVPGIAQLFAHCARAGVGHVRALRGDAVTVLRHLLAPDSLTGVRVFFPDPWPKRKHRGRRLLQPAVLALIATRLRPGGVLHVATDIADYAVDIARAGDAEPQLARLDGPAPISLQRPVTKFEGRAVRAEVAITDLVWGRLAP